MVAKTCSLPNIKRCFEPDPGFIIADFDLSKADAYVVAWEAEDQSLKDILLDPSLDLHEENAKVCTCGYKEAKAGVHLTNYGGKVPTLARAIGSTRAVAENFQRRWFGEHPGILEWHERVQSDLDNYRKVVNKFGYERVYFDRVEGLLPEALAWVPQSTVAIVITRALIAIDSELEPRVQTLLQVHDSGVFQFPRELRSWAMLEIGQRMEISVPYEDPLLIPVGAAISEKSWGDVEDVDWRTGEWLKDK